MKGKKQLPIKSEDRPLSAKYDEPIKIRPRRGILGWLQARTDKRVMTEVEELWTITQRAIHAHTGFLKAVDEHRVQRQESDLLTEKVIRERIEKEKAKEDRNYQKQMAELDADIAEAEKRAREARGERIANPAGISESIRQEAELERRLEIELNRIEEDKKAGMLDEHEAKREETIARKKFAQDKKALDSK